MIKAGDCVRWISMGWIGIVLYPGNDIFPPGVQFAHGSYDVAVHNLEVISEA